MPSRSRRGSGSSWPSWAVTAIASIVPLPPGWEVFGTTPAFEWGLMIIGYVFFARS